MKQKIVLAGGCFWGMQDLIRKQPGIIDTTVGYCGGAESTASYNHVKTGSTDHTEAIEVVYDNSQTSLTNILAFFFKIHDPTTLNQQGNDKGPQYRSVIFTDDTASAQEAIKTAQQNWQKPIVTEISTEMPFYPAEPEHQDYLERNPFGYTCHWVRKEKTS